MRLRDIAHVRTGDKGDISQIAVFAYRMKDFGLLESVLTADAIRAHFPRLPVGRIERYPVEGLGAINFVLHGALLGGVTRSTALDPHGKTLGAQLLDMAIVSDSAAE